MVVVLYTDSMREISSRGVVDRSRLLLRRSPDGRLRPANQEGDIAGIWAEQKRIRLAGAIEEDRRKAEKRQQGKWTFLRRKKPANATAPGGQPVAASQPKEVVVTINIPKIRLPKIPRERFSRFSRSLSVKRRFAIGAGLLLVLASIACFFIYRNGGQKDQAIRKKSVAAATIVQGSQQPEYDTLLPEGKSIQRLGGWSRVSPPDKEPVFAYVDSIDSVQVFVSQQPLPVAFKNDAVAEAKKLAQQLGTTEQLTDDGLTAFVSTSAKGPQATIAVKKDLLILIRSGAKIKNASWIGYINTLQEH